jgi:uncharacterized protein (TIGR00725 family)
MARKPVVGVMGGSAVSAEVEATAFELGRAVAARGWTLLNGGRNCGVMAASARGAKQAGGFTIGILPDRDAAAACPDLDVAIATGMGDARNLINVLSSDVVIALAGGAGTASEVALALKNGKRVILLGFPMSPAFEPARAAGLLSEANSVTDAITQAAEALGGPS